MEKLTSEQTLRLRCLEMANAYSCSTGGEICEHQQQQIASEYYNYVLTGEAGVHVEGFDHSQIAQA